MLHLAFSVLMFNVLTEKSQVKLPSRLPKKIFIFTLMRSSNFSALTNQIDWHCLDRCLSCLWCDVTFVVSIKPSVSTSIMHQTLSLRTRLVNCLTSDKMTSHFLQNSSCLWRQTVGRGRDFLCLWPAALQRVTSLPGTLIQGPVASRDARRGDLLRGLWQSGDRAARLLCC